MDKTKYISRLEDWLQEKHKVQLDAGHKAVIEMIWNKWEEDHPIISFVNEDTGQPELRLVYECYEESVPKKSFGEFRGMSDASSKTLGHRFSRREDGVLIHAAKAIGLAKGKDYFASIEPNPLPEGHFFTFDKLTSGAMLDGHVASVVFAINAFLMPLVGKDISSNMSSLFKSYETNRIKASLKDFITRCLPDVAKPVNDIQDMQNSKGIDWLYAGGDEVLQLRRAQAAQAYPPLFRIFANMFDYDTKDRPMTRGRLDAMLDAIDEGAELAPAIRDNLAPKPVAATIVKALSKFERPHPQYNDDSFFHILVSMEGLEPAHYPQNQEELELFYDCVSWVCKGSKEIYGYHDEVAILRTAKGQWQEWRDRFSSLDAVKNTKDWIDSFSSTIIKPYLWQQYIYEQRQAKVSEGGFDVNALCATFEEAVKGYESEQLTEAKKVLDERAKTITQTLMAHTVMPEIVEVSRDWHRNMRDYSIKKRSLRAIYNDDDGAHEWMPLTKVMQAPNGLWITPLTSSQMLEQQGKKQAHCVGTNSHYYAQCRAGYDHVVSISRDQDNNKPLTTAQLTEQRSGYNGENVDGIKNSQHKGYDNAPPCSEAQAALEWYLDQVMNDAEVKPDWAAIETPRAKARSQTSSNEIEKEIGFDPLDVDAHEMAFSFLKPYMPNKFTKMNMHKIVKAIQKAERKLVADELAVKSAEQKSRPRKAAP